MPSSGRGAGSLCRPGHISHKTRRKSTTNQRKNQTIKGWGTYQLTDPKDLFNALFLGKVRSKDNTLDDVAEHNAVISINGKEVTPVIKALEQAPTNFDSLRTILETIVNNHDQSIDKRLKALDELQQVTDACRLPWAYDYINGAKKWIEDHRKELEEISTSRR